MLYVGRTFRSGGLFLVAAFVAAFGCGRAPQADRRVIVIGIDGMDYAVVRDLMAAGRMPNFSTIAQGGGVAPLATTNPPQSPVAWSSFITGEDPGQYGIYDFIHRDPGTMQPFLSTTRTVPGRTVTAGPWRVPITSGHVEMLRAGAPFWSALTARGIDATIVRMPANYPPSGTASRELSGMGTPDLRGDYGTFTLFTSDPARVVSSDAIVPVMVQNGEVRGALVGPENPFKARPTPVAAPFVVHVDARAPVAKLVIGTEKEKKEERILHVGEWSDWVPVSFGLAPLERLHGMARFYLKQAHPSFELYVSPVNLDPLNPAMPLSTPGTYAAELASATGRYYTQGMPEDTKALSQGVLTRDEFLTQAGLAHAENLSQYRYELGRFRRGLLFYYFGHLDQVSHMMWRPRDPGHPAYDAARDAPYAHVVDDLYVTFDGIVGETLARMPADTTLMVMSDHGFTTWRRSFSLNAWLEQNGYLAVIDPARRERDVLANIDWSRTRAYGLGLNGLYINVRGREKNGIVAPDARAALVAEIAARLESFQDPATGQLAVKKAYRREEVYAATDFPDLSPDLLIGYAAGTRVSNESALGAVPRDVVTDNRDEWSGDHCMDPSVVPGILLWNRPLRTHPGSLQQLAAAIFAEFGVERPARIVR